MLPSPQPTTARLLLIILPQKTASVAGIEARTLKPDITSNFLTVLSADPVTMKLLKVVSRKLIAPPCTLSFLIS